MLHYQIKEALLEPRVWFVAGQRIAIGIINPLAGFGYRPNQASREAVTSEATSACNDVGEDGFKDLTDSENRNLYNKL